jgi:hypothetical protein
MTTNIQQGSLLDVLKKKMRQTKEEMERYKDECEEYNKRLHAECMRREEVSITDTFWRFSANGRRPPSPAENGGFGPIDFAPR